MDPNEYIKSNEYIEYMKQIKNNIKQCMKDKTNHMIYENTPHGFVQMDIPYPDTHTE